MAPGQILQTALGLRGLAWEKHAGGGREISPPGREAAGWAPLAQSRRAMSITVLGNAEGEAPPWADSAPKLRWRNLTPFSLQRQCEALKQVCFV